jgi:hypothetical protein
MPAFDPATFIAGPAVITFNGASIFSKGDIAVQCNRETWDVMTSMHGRIDQRLKSFSAEVTLTPCGEVENLTKLYPYAAAQIGANIFPAVDLPLVIHTLAGQKYTFARAAIIKMPGMKLSATDTLFGDMGFLCLLKSNTAPTVADAFLKIEAAAFSDATFSEAAVISPGYTAAYGATPYDAMESVEGFSVEFAMDITRDYVDRAGLIGARLKSLSASARFKPTGLTEAQWKTLCVLEGSDVVVPGESLSKSDTDLVISGTGLSVTIHKAGIQASGLAFGDASRLGELVFTHRRSWTAGVADALWTITAS